MASGILHDQISIANIHNIIKKISISGGFNLVLYWQNHTLFVLMEELNCNKMHILGVEDINVEDKI